MNERLRGILLTPEATIRDALAAIDRGGCEIALVVEDDDRLVGVVTDGDVRRALLDGKDLDDLVAPHVTRRPYCVDPDARRTEVLDLMTARSIGQVPVVADGRVVGLHVMREVIGAAERPNWAVVMAGGRGTRLAPVTDHVPKPMLPVAGRPILERIVLHLVGGGIRRVFLAVNYKAEMIEAHFGDGTDFGCSIEYLREDPDRPLGTGGSLALLAGRDDLPPEPLVVMNGDLVTQFPVDDLLRHHAAEKAAATVAVREYHHEVPFGVVQLSDDGAVTDVAEKPAVTWPVNAGIYAFEPHLLERVPRDREFPVTDLVKGCLERGDRVAAWVLDDEWHDVGRHEELRRARGEL